MHILFCKEFSNRVKKEAQVYQFSKFVLQRRKKSTRDVLTKIREDLEGIEEFKQSTQAWHKKLIGYLLAYFSVIYLIAALIGKSIF